MTQRDDFELEAALTAARAAPPPMPGALAQRILADALAAQTPAPLWRRIIAGLGGPVGLGGLVTATVAGFWIGVAPPDALPDPLVLMGVVAATEEEDVGLNGLGWDSEEG